MRTRLVALFVPLALGLAACGSDGAATDTAADPSEPAASAAASQEPAGAGGAAAEGTLDGVSTSGEPGAEPTVKVADPPFSIDETTVEVLEEGSGPVVEEGNRVEAQLVLVNGRDGKVIDSTYGQDGPPVSLNATEGQLLAGLYKGLLGQREGSRVAIAVPPVDAFGTAGFPQGNVQPDDTVVFVVDIEKVKEVAPPLAMAQGEERQAPADLPSLQVNDEGVPTGFAADENTADELDKLIAEPVIVGDGKKVKSGQTVTVHYLGQLYPDGKIFDQSWTRGEPATFQIGTGSVIAGWDEGIVGQTVGSRVILAIPPEQAYGKQGSPPDIPANAPLIFAVDILAAS